MKSKERERVLFGVLEVKIKPMPNGEKLPEESIFVGKEFDKKGEKITKDKYPDLEARADYKRRVDEGIIESLNPSLERGVDEIAKEKENTEKKLNSAKSKKELGEKTIDDWSFANAGIIRKIDIDEYINGLEKSVKFLETASPRRGITMDFKKRLDENIEDIKKLESLLAAARERTENVRTKLKGAFDPQI